MNGVRSPRSLALLIPLMLGGCATVQTTQPGAVGIERKQTMLVSEESVEQGAINCDCARLPRTKAAPAAR